MENLHIRHILVKFHRLKNDAVYIVNSADIESTAYTEVTFKPSSFLFDKVVWPAWTSYKICMDKSFKIPNSLISPVEKNWLSPMKIHQTWWTFIFHSHPVVHTRFKRVILHTRLHQHPKNIACSQQLWTPTNLLIVEAAVWGAGDPSGEARGTLLSV